MEGVFMLIFLCITMLIGSFLSGLLPLALSLSESKMRHITIIGAGLLIGTALAVIIPEGIHTLYSNEKCLSGHFNEHSSHVHKRSLNGFDDIQFKRLSKADQDLIDVFLKQINENMNVNHVIKKSFNPYQDLSNLLSKKSSSQTRELIKKSNLNQEDKKKLEILFNQMQAYNQMNIANIIVRHSAKKRDTIGDAKQQLGDKLAESQKEHELAANEQLKIKIKSDLDHPETHSESKGNAHSAIGITLILGFVFMLIIDQIGGKFSHRPHQILDTQAVRNKITFSTTLGLVVHAAADGIALGAAAATSKTDIEMIVFVAIMLHKAPAAFGLVSFLMHEGLDRAKIRKHLIIFALSAPLMAIFTFAVLNSKKNMSVVSSDSTGLCMLFSAGTFLYVSTVHVLPEVQSHNEDRQFRFGEMLSFILGALMPIFLSFGHSH